MSKGYREGKWKNKWPKLKKYRQQNKECSIGVQPKIQNKYSTIWIDINQPSLTMKKKIRQTQIEKHLTKYITPSNSQYNNKQVKTKKQTRKE